MYDIDDDEFEELPKSQPLENIEVLDDWKHHWNSVLMLISESSKFINIASFGIHLPPKRVALRLWEASELSSVKIRMLIGRHEPYRREAIGSILLLQQKLDNVRTMLPKVSIRTIPGHTKLVMNEQCAIVGGRNLSFSGWPDLSFRFWKSNNPSAFSKTSAAFDRQFEAGEPLTEFMKFDQQSLERQYEKFVEEKIEQKTKPVSAADFKALTPYLR